MDPATATLRTASAPICRALVPDGFGPLERLRAARARRKRLATLEEEAIRAARRAGHSWEEVALALGTSRQAAWQRWRKRSAQELAEVDR